MKIILEFSETSQDFHFNHGSIPENTNGYKTISENIDVEKAYFFIEKFLQHKVDKKKLTLIDVTKGLKIFEKTLKAGQKNPAW